MKIQIIVVFDTTLDTIDNVDEQVAQPLLTTLLDSAHVHHAHLDEVRALVTTDRPVGMDARKVGR